MAILTPADGASTGDLVAGARPEKVRANTMADKKYLVNGITDDTEWSRIMTAAEIFDFMDMDDCQPSDIDIWKINGYGEALTECGFIGKWMFNGDPQRMEIRTMDGEIEVGYGTEH